MEKEETVKKEVKIINKYNGSAGGAVYGLGLIGALFYFLQNASGFNEVMIGIFKSLAWPAFLIFRVLTLLKM